MSDFENRLKASDPAASQTYQHPDTEAMIARIITQAPLARRNVWRSFQLKMAGAVTMATLVTVGAIAALQGAAPGLAVLALSAPGANAKAAVPSGYTSSVMRIYEEFNFTAGPDLSSSTSTGAAYALQLPASASAEAARIASIFSVSGTAVDQNGDGTDWTITDPSGDSVDYQNYGGVPQWYFSQTLPGATASPSAVQSAPSEFVSTEALDADVQGYLAKLGYGYQVASPQYSTSSTSTVAGPGGPTVTTNEETVSYTVTVDGTPTGQSVQFTFDQSGNVTDASGPAFSVASSTNYPLQSPVAGVAVLNAQQKNQFSSAGTGAGTGSGGGTVEPMASATSTTVLTPPSGTTGSSGASTGPATPPDTTDTTPTTTPAGPPIVDVTLDSVSLSLQSYTLTDGSVWLLPVYSYTGDIVSADGTSSTGTWTTIAVDPAYVTVASTAGLNHGGPLNS